MHTIAPHGHMPCFHLQLADKGSYFRSPWNWLDFTVVSTSVLAELLAHVGWVEALRLLRVLRPLRLIARSKQMKVGWGPACRRACGDLLLRDCFTCAVRVPAACVARAPGTMSWPYLLLQLPVPCSLDRVVHACRLWWGAWSHR